MSTSGLTVVALVPAKDSGDTIGATVTALINVADVDRVLVIDDGSADATADEARLAGATVLRLPRNIGKGGAVLAGAQSAPDADVYLLIDADVAGTSSVAGALLRPVLDGSADLVIGVLPAAGSRGGFGLVREVARRGIERACGFRPRAPLSGQRAIRAGLLRDLKSAGRFGLEVAMTIDAVRSGARVHEVDVAMDHDHRGRTVGGFRHRARQGADVISALWPRLVGPRARLVLTVVTTVLVLVAMLVSAAAVRPSSVPASAQPGKVVVVAVPHLGLDDLATGRLTAIDALRRDGAMAAMSVRTLSSRPSNAEAYATLGAGTRVRSPAIEIAAYPADEPYEGATAGEVLERRTGQLVDGDIAVLSAPAVQRGAGKNTSSVPGALGEALRDAGHETAVVGSSDFVGSLTGWTADRPVALALMDTAGAVTHGLVERSELLEEDLASPFGFRADHGVHLLATQNALRVADVVLVDPGDTARAVRYAPLSTPDQAEVIRQRALARTDQFIGELNRQLDDSTLLLVVGLTPPTREWALTPIVAHGAGVSRGYMHSLSTNRLGLVTLTDLSATILGSFDVERPDGMIGSALRYAPGDVDFGELQRQNDMANGREGVYFPMTLTFIIVQALTYLFIILALGQGAERTGLARYLRFLVCTFASWPLATFALRVAPATYDLGGASQIVVWAVAVVIALLALRSRTHALSPLAWICGITAAVMILDVATGARLQISSILGYSPHTAARFTGFGNTAFAVLAATATLFAAIHVDKSPRRRDAYVTACCFLLIVVVADGAPMLGSDVGGILTLVPVFGLMLYSMSGRRISTRVVVAAGLATAAAVALAAGIDLLRGPGERTHLGNFVADIFSGEGTFVTTINRKWATNVRVFRSSVWTWMVPIIAIYLIYVLVLSKGWRRLLPPSSALRAGIIACLVAGVLGWLVNDSGIVVTALIFVYAGPYLTLLALADGGRADVLPPLGEQPAPGTARPAASAVT